MGRVAQKERWTSMRICLLQLDNKYTFMPYETSNAAWLPYSALSQLKPHLDFCFLEVTPSTEGFCKPHPSFYIYHGLNQYAVSWTRRPY